MCRAIRRVTWGSGKTGNLSKVTWFSKPCQSPAHIPSIPLPFLCTSIPVAFAPSNQHLCPFVGRHPWAAGAHLPCAHEQKQKCLQIYISQGLPLTNDWLTGGGQLPFQVWLTLFPDLPYPIELQLNPESCGTLFGVAHSLDLPFPVSHCQPPACLFWEYFLINDFHRNPCLRRNPCLWAQWSGFTLSIWPQRASCQHIQVCTGNQTYDFPWSDLLQKDETMFWHQSQSLLYIFPHECIVQTKSYNGKWLRYVIWAQPELKSKNTLGVLVNFSNHRHLFKELLSLGL